MDVVQTAPYDLLLRGGRVIDPAQKLDGVMDVAVRDGLIAAIGRPDASWRRSRRTKRRKTYIRWRVRSSL